MALIRIHPAGRYWVGGVLGLGLLLAGVLVWTAAPWGWWLGVGLGWGLLVAFMLNFFRYPWRSGPFEPDKIYAPCDGRVVLIQRTFEPRHFQQEMLQISIFMSPLNVHVNWAPASGTLMERQYQKGYYFVAWHPKASLLNEQSFLAVVGDSPGRHYALRQIAGILARRILTYPELSSFITQGEEIGFILFGSRVDVLLPLDVKLHVEVGARVKGAITPIASW